MDIEKNFQRRKNDSGFVLIFFVPLIALLISAFILITAYAAAAKKEMGFKKKCLNMTWSSLQKQKNFLQKLQGLNSKAQSLRQQNQRALLRLKKAIVSGQAPLIAAAKLHLQLIQARRIQLDLRQRQLLFESKLEAARVQQALQKSLPQARVKAPPLAVRPDQVEVAPIYVLTSGFVQNQATGAQWTLHWSTLLPKGWLKIIERQSPYFLSQQIAKKECYTTLEQRSEKWFTKILKVSL